MTRPWQVTSVTPGRLDRTLVWALPLAVLVVSRAVYTWFAAPAHLILVLGAWLLFALVLRRLMRGRDRFALSAAIGGVALGRTLILLVPLAGRGPGRYWYDFWTEPTLRFLYITVAFAAFCWTFVVAYRVLRDAYGLRRREATGATMIQIGVPLALLGALIAAIGLERALTVWNDQMALLPWGLSRILGITTYLGIPTALPDAAAVLGLALIAGGLLPGMQKRLVAPHRGRVPGE